MGNENKEGWASGASRSATQPPSYTASHGEEERYTEIEKNKNPQAKVG